MATSKHGEIHVTKRDGRRELLNIEKIHRQVMWATEGISGVSASEVEIRSQLQFYPGMKTRDIQETLIKAAADLITEETPNYQYVAGRLINYHIRKEVYGGINPSTIHEHVSRVVDEGYYDPALVAAYTTDEWKIMETYIDHDRDYELTYVAMEQWRGKYLVKNRVTGRLFETPQIAYMLISATLFASYPKETRLKWIKDYYDAISNHDVSLPTPVMAGVRTPQRQFSSCVLIECDDSLNSIIATGGAIVKYVSQKAGIGINVGSIRGVGSAIRSGDAYHTGIVNFIKKFQADVKSCNQGGIRGGAATVYFPFWHLEFEDIVVLKNNKGTEENRARHMDYGVQFNKLAYERLLTGGNLTLFSPKDVPGLYDAFFADQDRFKELYEAAEKNTKIRKKTLKAIDLFTMFMQERKNTGRVYLMNVDHANTHSSFIESEAPVKQSNLCAEITLPTKPLEDLNDPNGLIALCTLSAINWGKIREPKDFEKPCTLAVRGLDALLSYQNYPVLAAQKHTELYRPLGVGIINFAYWLAKNGLKYSDDAALEMVDEYAEAWSYYLIKASIDLAREKGACEGVQNTKYSRGIMPIDTRKKEVDELVPYQERMPWDNLRAAAREVGIRNSTLMALMPSESSSQLSNATNGIEPPRSYISIKQSKDGVLRQVVPEYRRLKNRYELLWDQTSPEGYLKIAAVLQKYIDQSISINTSYNPEHYDDQQLTMSELLRHMVLGYKWGHKTWYYMNTHDGAGEVQVDKLVQADAKVENSAPQDDATCDACVL
jgi:ribonucleoside-diphosphate reductase alpha chain